MSENAVYYCSSLGSLSSTLTHWIEELGDSFRIGLLYSPQSCIFVKVNDQGLLTNHSEEQADTANVFEARVFTEHAEFRWLRKDRESGTAVLISDRTSVQRLQSFKATKPYIKKIQHDYLLWGETTGAISRSWSKLAESQIGQFWCPVEEVKQHGRRIQLRAVEYLAPVDNYGNVAVIEERLVGLKVE